MLCVARLAVVTHIQQKGLLATGIVSNRREAKQELHLLQNVQWKLREVPSTSQSLSHLEGAQWGDTKWTHGRSLQCSLKPPRNQTNQNTANHFSCLTRGQVRERAMTMTLDESGSTTRLLRHVILIRIPQSGISQTILRATSVWGFMDWTLTKCLRLWPKWKEDPRS